MKRFLKILAVAALAVVATDCARHARATGPTTGDGISVDLNTTGNASGL